MNYATLKLVVCSLKVLGSLILEGFKDRTNVSDVRMKLEAYVTCQVKKSIGIVALTKRWLQSRTYYSLFIYLSVYFTVLSVGQSIYRRTLLQSNIQDYK
jgi:hypothetical protein